MSKEKTFKIVDGDISDGFHTFDELYEHRVILYLFICMQNKERCFIQTTGIEWFILYCETPYGQVSYHLPSKYLDMCRKYFDETPHNKWDGHTSEQVLERVMGWMMSGLK